MRVQEIGGRTAVDCFRTLGTAVAELEANLPTIAERHMRKALWMWIDLYSMLETHLFAPLIRRRGCKRFASPTYRIVEPTHAAPIKELKATRFHVSVP